MHIVIDQSIEYLVYLCITINLIIEHINMNWRCMLIILLLCVLKISGQIDETTDNNYDEEYDDYENSSENEEATTALTSLSSDSSVILSNTSEISAAPITTSLIEPTSSLAFTTVSTIEPSTILTEKITKEFKGTDCPKSCKCSAAFDIVDCSQQNLINIPKNIPQNTIQLNLSHNLLTTFNVSDLINYSELRQLYLSNNLIETIVNTDDFAMLPNLHHIDLSLNVLKPLNGKEFSEARGLATLILSGNKDIVTENVPIVQTHKLKTLHLANCSITNLSDNIFQNLSSLIVLDLDKNPFDLALNYKAFKYLVTLRTLNLATVSRDIVLDLCSQLKSLDIIHLTAETYEISCFLLTSGSSFDESIIRYGQSTLSPLDIEGNDLYKEHPKSVPKPQKKTTTEKPVNISKNETNHAAVMETLAKTSMYEISTLSQNETKTEKSNVTEPSSEKTVATQARVDVSQHVIYMLLIGVIAVTLAALLIGIVCRLDCCGIKTKCCRRSHNRAETEDRVQPHEEIPLNKV